MSNQKIDSIDLYLPREKKGMCDELRQYGTDEINSKLVDDIICQLKQHKVSRIELDNNDVLVGMSVYVEGDLSQISISDEVHDLIYYFDNGSGNSSTVGIAGEEFYKWMVCSEIDTLIDVLKKFIATGERLVSPAWSWLKESTW